MGGFLVKNEKRTAFAVFGKTARRAAVLLLLIFAAAVLLGACGTKPQPDDVSAPDQSVSGVEEPSSEEASAENATEAPAVQVNVVPTAVSALKLTEKDTEAFTMQIPEGWEIRYGWDGEKMLMLRVWDPETPVNQIFYATDMVPFMKNQASADAYAISGTTLFSEAPVLDPATNETLFRQIPALRRYYLETVKSESTAAILPDICDFELLENLPVSSAFNADSLDDSIVYGTFTNADGVAGEGIGFASIVDLFGFMPSPLYGTDMSYYNVYNFTAITSARDEFVNYEELLCQSFASLQLKQEFVEKMLKNSEDSFAYLQEVNASVTASYYNYNDAWLARSQSSDISRQKYSDATLGYERVYDTETGEIYKAYNGFTDDYSGTRYQPVTDEMYTQGWSGYIEK